MIVHQLINLALNSGKFFGLDKLDDSCIIRIIYLFFSFFGQMRNDLAFIRRNVPYRTGNSFFFRWEGGK